jgi:MYXO-CTERM domain-containing protein
MIVETEISVSAPVQRVWEELSDLEALAAVLPGSQLRPVDGDSMLQGALRPELRGSAVDCIGTLRPVDVDHDTRSASCQFRVRQANGPGFATGTLRGRVSGENGSARVALALDGRLAAPGMDETSARDDADKLLAALASGLEKSLAERAARPAQPKPKPAPRRAAPASEVSAAREHAAAVPMASTPSRPGPPPVAIAGIFALVLALLLGRRSRRRSARRPW